MEDYYKSIGFKCGLEIHQRLDTKSKLFCGCITDTKDEEKPIGNLYRYQRAVAGEEGGIDITAEIEQNKRKRYIYNIFKDNTCLVDLDEEPPHDVNKEALITALSVALGLHLQIFRELEPMRKEVVDGSNTSAFQRTIIVGLNGYIKVVDHKINITSMMLEEESAGIVSNGESESTFNTDRLGIPLVEIDTDPYISSPSEAKEVASYIGTLLRITGKVKRGIGTIRQDVNVSIKGGDRTEIKGFQDLSNMDKFIENEIKRQQALIKLKEDLKEVNFEFGELMDLTDIFVSTKVKIISNSLNHNGSVIGIRVSNFKGYLGREVNPDRRFGSEVSDYAKLAGVKGIIHSDEDLSKYNLTQSEIDMVKKNLSIGEKDAFILVTAEKDKAIRAINYALYRIKIAKSEIPKETRSVLNDQLYTTRFMRPVAGGFRMYPETDIKPIFISNDLLNEAKELIPDLDKEVSDLKEFIKDETYIRKLILSPHYQMYKFLSKNSSVDRKLIAEIVTQRFTELRRDNYDVDKLDEGILLKAMDMYSNGQITKKGIIELLKYIIKYGDGEDLDKVLDKINIRKLSKDEIIKLINEYNNYSKDERIVKIMSDNGLRIDGKELNDIMNSL